MKWINTKDQLPELQQDEDMFEQYTSILCLIKDKWGKRFTAKLKQYYDEDEKQLEGEPYWELAGRDAYHCSLEDIIQYMPCPE